MAEVTGVSKDVFNQIGRSSVVNNLDAASFKDLLGDIFNRSMTLVKDYADTSTEDLWIPGIGMINKYSAAAGVGVAKVMQDSETQVSTIMNYLTLVYKTWPQILQQSQA